jgi:hypothetical protein
MSKRAVVTSNRNIFAHTSVEDAFPFKYSFYDSCKYNSAYSSFFTKQASILTMKIIHILSWKSAWTHGEKNRFSHAFKLRCASWLVSFIEKSSIKASDNVRNLWIWPVSLGCTWWKAGLCDLSYFQHSQCFRQDEKNDIGTEGSQWTCLKTHA